MGMLAQYLNYQAKLSTRDRNSTDPAKKANASEAESLLRRLVSMRPDDIAGFRGVMKAASDFGADVKERPWLFTDDGKEIARSGNLALRKAVLPVTVMMLSKRPTGNRQNAIPTWCTKGESYSTQYSNQGPLYFVDKDEKPYVLAHFHSGQVKDLSDMEINNDVAAEIAPLFINQDRFPEELLRESNTALADHVMRLRRGHR